MTAADKVSLREYVEMIFSEREKAMQRAQETIDARLEHLNQLRDDVIKDRAVYMERSVYGPSHTRAV